jgi:opacity protein-like surface antigen
MPMSHAKSKVIIALSIIISLTHLAFPSQADSRQRHFSLSLSAGYLWDTTFGRLNPLRNTADVPAITVSLENIGASFGLSFGYALNERFELQGSFTYGRSRINDDVGIGFAGIPLGKSKVADAHNLTYNANILFYLTPTRIAPFFTAGLGVISLKPDKLPSSTKFLFNYGVGVKVRLSRNLSVFGDLKDHVSFFNYLRDFDVTYIAIYSPDFKKTQHRIGINLGLSYTF